MPCRAISDFGKPVRAKQYSPRQTCACKVCGEQHEEDFLKDSHEDEDCVDTTHNERRRIEEEKQEEA